jgi:MoaA/NifB/PqqE/SkfB family radical SAM enzyme
MLDTLPTGAGEDRGGPSLLDRFFGRRRGAIPVVPAPVSSACYAPHSALYFQPDGLVRACCVTAFAIGSVMAKDRPSLTEMWNGAVLASQRRALEAGDFRVGCQECEMVEAAGGRAATVAHHFDRFREGAPHQFPKLLDFALSSRCNLQCVMCNGELSSAIRTQRDGLPPLPDAYDDRFFAELEEFLPHAERLQFKGGEPFLARENRRIWDVLIEQGISPEISVTTNGTVFNEKVERYVATLRMHPNVSVDGMTADTLESIRLGVDSRSLWRNIDRFQELAEVSGSGMTLSFCLMQMNWREVLPFLREADRRRVNCNVIFVHQPAGCDLLRLPPEELSTVRRELAEAEPDFATSEPARIWDEIIARLDAQLERPVEIIVSAVLSVGNEVQRRIRAGVVSAAGSEPLVATADADGLISDIEEPPWAAWMEPSKFVGHPMESIGRLLQTTIGDIRVELLHSDIPGVEHLAIRVDTPSGPRHLRLQRFIEAETDRYRAFVSEIPEA